MFKAPQEHQQAYHQAVVDHLSNHPMVPQLAKIDNTKGNIPLGAQNPNLQGQKQQGSFIPFSQPSTRLEIEHEPRQKAIHRTSLVRSLIHK